MNFFFCRITAKYHKKKKKKKQFVKENSKNSKLKYFTKQKLGHTLDTILLESPQMSEISGR